MSSPTRRRSPIRCPGELSTVVVLDTADGSVVAEHPAPGAVAFAVLPDDGGGGGRRVPTTRSRSSRPGCSTVSRGGRTTVPAPTGQGGRRVPGREHHLVRHGRRARRRRVARADGPPGPARGRWSATTSTQVPAGRSTRSRGRWRRCRSSPAGTSRTTFVGRDGADVDGPREPRAAVRRRRQRARSRADVRHDAARVRPREPGRRAGPSPEMTADTALVLRGRVYVSSGRGLVAIDAGTGEELWRTRVPEGRSVGGLVTDGRHLLSSQQRPDPASERQDGGVPEHRGARRVPPGRRDRGLAGRPARRVDGHLVDGVDAAGLGRAGRVGPRLNWSVRVIASAGQPNRGQVHSRSASVPVGPG